MAVRQAPAEDSSMEWQKGKAGSPVTPRDPCSDRRLNLEHTSSYTRETSTYLVKTMQGGFVAMNTDLRLRERSLLKVRSQ